MSNEAAIRELLYRALVELSYIIELAPEVIRDKDRRCLIATAEGEDIVKSGMKALGIADLSGETLAETKYGDSNDLERLAEWESLYGKRTA